MPYPFNGGFRGSLLKFISFSAGRGFKAGGVSFGFLCAGLLSIPSLSVPHFRLLCAAAYLISVDAFVILLILYNRYNDLSIVKITQ
jgi:hypothetical protein